MVLKSLWRRKLSKRRQENRLMLKFIVKRKEYKDDQSKRRSKRRKVWC